MYSIVSYQAQGESLTKHCNLTVAAKDGAGATEDALTGSHKRFIFSTFISYHKPYSIHIHVNIKYK